LIASSGLRSMRTKSAFTQTVLDGLEQREDPLLAQDPLRECVLELGPPDGGSYVEGQVAHLGGEREERLERSQSPSARHRRPTQGIRVALQVREVGRAEAFAGKRAEGGDVLAVGPDRMGALAVQPRATSSSSVVQGGIGSAAISVTASSSARASGATSGALLGVAVSSGGVARPQASAPTPPTDATSRPAAFLSCRGWVSHSGDDHPSRRPTEIIARYRKTGRRPSVF
jgi:hypothetical protein